jgi:hypothetical protein
MSSQVIGRESDVVVGQSGEEIANVTRLESGQVGHDDERRARTAQSDVFEGAIDHGREDAVRTIAARMPVVEPGVRPALLGELGDVIAVSRDEDPVEFAGNQDIEDVLEKVAGERGALFVRKHGA